MDPAALIVYEQLENESLANTDFSFKDRVASDSVCTENTATKFILALVDLIVIADLYSVDEWRVLP